MPDTPIVILAIESSCDDTAAAVMVDGVIRSNIISSQAIHAEYGGIVPEVASRMHQENISLVVDRALKVAEVGLKQIIQPVGMYLPRAPVHEPKTYILQK